MRWALRNQDRIKAHFEPYGDEILERIKESLEQAFKSDDIEKHIDKAENEPYPILDVNDVGHSFGTILFYVIKKTYDVYLLAFKEFIS